MPATPIAYRVVAGSDERWFDEAAAADAAVAQLLRVSADQVGALRRPITVDPVVVRRADGRWRSRRAWSAHHESTLVRVFEMLHIDESQYDH